jgi:hypothetical protein
VSETAAPTDDQIREFLYRNPDVFRTFLRAEDRRNPEWLRRWFRREARINGTARL